VLAGRAWPPWEALVGGECSWSVRRHGLMMMLRVTMALSQRGAGGDDGHEDVRRSTAGLVHGEAAEGLNQLRAGLVGWRSPLTARAGRVALRRCLRLRARKRLEAAPAVVGSAAAPVALTPEEAVLVVARSGEGRTRPLASGVDRPAYWLCVEPRWEEIVQTAATGRNELTSSRCCSVVSTS